MERVTEEDQLLRRLAPDMIGPDGTVLSNAYKKNSKPDPQVSVDLERLTSMEAAWERRSAHKKDEPGWAVGRLPARVPIEQGLTVRHVPEPDNESHCIIVEERSPSPLTPKQRCRVLASATQIIFPPGLVAKSA